MEEQRTEEKEGKMQNERFLDHIHQQRKLSYRREIDINKPFRRISLQALPRKRDKKGKGGK